jgi:hypothetical protein
LRGGPQSGGYAAIFRIGKFDGVFYGRLGKIATLYDVAELNRFETSREIGAPFASHFDPVISNLFPLLSQDVDDIGAHTAANGNQ